MTRADSDVISFVQFTMQQAVLQHFPGVQGTYRFTHRDKDVFFTRECFDLFVRSVAREFTRIGVLLTIMLHV